MKTEHFLVPALVANRLRLFVEHLLIKVIYPVFQKLAIAMIRIDTQIYDNDTCFCKIV